MWFQLCHYLRVKNSVKVWIESNFPRVFLLFHDVSIFSHENSIGFGIFLSSPPPSPGEFGGRGGRRPRLRPGDQRKLVSTFQPISNIQHMRSNWIIAPSFGIRNGKMVETNTWKIQLMGLSWFKCAKCARLFGGWIFRLGTIFLVQIHWVLFWC